MAMTVAAMVFRPGTAVAQRPAQGTIGVSATVLPAPRPTMDALLEAGSAGLEASALPASSFQPRASQTSAAAPDSLAAPVNARRRVRVLAWVGT